MRRRYHINQRQRSLWHVAAGIGLLMGGIAYLTYPVIRAQQQVSAGRILNGAYVQSLESSATARQDMLLGRLVALSLPRLGIETDILPGAYDSTTRTWTLDNQHAFFMSQSKTPIIYGHSIPSVFKPLSGVATGEILTIRTADSRTVALRYTGDRQVPPTADEVLRETIPDTVLLMTCSGQYSQYRRLLSFAYIGEVAAGGALVARE